MGDSLGIDVGATTCAAAVSRGSTLAACRLGKDGATMPAVALPGPDGIVIVGAEADRRSPHEPAVVARQVTAGLLDPEPVVIDGVTCHPLPLTEALLSEVIARAGRAGASPEHVIVAFPLRGGGAPERLLAEAAHRATGGAAVLVPAPIAAAAKLAHDRDLGPEALVAVLDVGGASVDVALVRATPEVFDLVGDPVSLVDVGGIDVDEEMMTLTESAIGDVRSNVSPDDHVSLLALRRLRASCRAAKEHLATEHAAIVDVALPQARAQVEITQGALATAIEPMLEDVVDALLSTVDEAGLIPADIATVLVVGGSARLPGLVETVEERTGRPVIVDDEPALTVALGAALFGAVADQMPAVADVPTSAPVRGVPSPLAGAAGAVAGAGLAAADARDGPAPGWPDPEAHDGSLAAAYPPDPPPLDAPRAPYPPDPPPLDGPGASYPLGPPPPAEPLEPPAPPAPLPLDSPFLAGLPTLDGPSAAPPGQAFGPPGPAPLGDPYGPPDPEPHGSPFGPPGPAPLGDPYGPPDPPVLGADGPPNLDPPPRGQVAAGYDPFGDRTGGTSVFDDPPALPGPDLPTDMGLAAPPMPLGAPGDDPLGRMPVPPLRTGEVWPALDDSGWTDDEADDAEWGPHGSRWDDMRTSVFDDAPAEPGAEATDWGQPADDEFRRLTTSDTDPFRNRSGALATRLRTHDQQRDGTEDDDDIRPFDLRLIAAGALAAVVLVALAAFAVLSGDGGSDPIAVADTAPPSSSDTTTGTAALTANSTTTTSSTTTTAPPEEDDDPPYVPPTTAPPPVTPPPTQPPPPPPTTTTRPPPPPPPPPPPTSTSTSSTTSTTVFDPPGNEP